MHASLVGAAGVYFVASRLNAMDLHCAPTFGSVPNVDILVSSPDGSASLSLQVKTTWQALREKGRGTEKKPDHYEWDIGWHCARLRASNLLFALVDLKGFSELPDVFVVPSKVIADYFDPTSVASSGVWSMKQRPDPDKWTRARYHELVEELEQYRNNWAPMLQLNQREQHAA
jgi:hypothetical protein